MKKLYLYIFILIYLLYIFEFNYDSRILYIFLWVCLLWLFIYNLAYLLQLEIYLVFDFNYLIKYILVSFISLEIFLRKILNLNTRERNIKYILKYIFMLNILNILTLPFYYILNLNFLRKDLRNINIKNSFNIVIIFVFLLIFFSKNISIIFILVLLLLDSLIIINYWCYESLHISLFSLNKLYVNKFIYFINNITSPLNTTYYMQILSKFESIKYKHINSKIIIKLNNIYNDFWNKRFIIYILKSYYESFNDVYFILGQLRTLYFNYTDDDDDEIDYDFKQLFKNNSIEDILNSFEFYNIKGNDIHYNKIYLIMYNVIGVLKNNNYIFEMFCKFAEKNKFYEDIYEYKFIQLKEFEEILKLINDNINKS